MNIQLYNVGPSMPPQLKALEELANNIWWCWHPSAIDLFMRIYPNLWRELSSNVKEFLRRVPQSRLEELARDRAFLNQLSLVEKEFHEGVKEHDDRAKRNIAYFSLEFGIHESIPIFSGGLGVLAGDHLKSSSDLKLPLVGVGLLYRQGYFRQVLDRNGWQNEHYPVTELYNLSIERGCDAEGKEVTISLRLRDRELFAAVWILKVGGTPLVLLDTELPQNPPDFREVSWRLYGGNKEMRLRQELLLGIGGYKALIALGYNPEVCHMNEGHAGFLSLARIAHLVNDLGYEPDVALEIVWRSNVFTTHTPVPAGNEVFDLNLLRPYLEVFAAEAHLDVNRVIRWGIPINQRDNAREMSMTVFGLRLANYSNGVSKLHGEVAREMWRELWPQRSVSEVPIKHITNGVHISSWISNRLGSLYNHYLPQDWRITPDVQQLRDGLAALPDEELWMTHEFCRQSLVRRARKLLLNKSYFRSNGETSGHTVQLDPDILTIGFARRFATYKRGTLLLRHPDRLLALLRDSNRPIQFIFAGKAHPADTEGKKLIQQLIDFARRENVQNRFVFLENYDIGLARSLVQGVDVWLNTPLRPQEASGTSGMKAAVNGVINCSILDGWWAEAYNNLNGWAISDGKDCLEIDDRDNQDSLELFNLLENEIIPCFYERAAGDLPLRWIRRMKESIITGIGTFSSARMVNDYNTMFYQPAISACRTLMKDQAKEAKDLVAVKQRLVENFTNRKLYIAPPQCDRPLQNVHVGDTFTVTTTVQLGTLSPDDVAVEAYYGIIDAHNDIRDSKTCLMKKVGDLGNNTYRYCCELPCREAGRFGLTARIKANGDAWDNSIPGFVCWAD